MAVKKDRVQLDVEINGKKAGTTYSELQKNVRDLNREVSKLEPGTADFIKKSEDLQKVKARLGEVRDEINGIDRSWMASIKSAFSFQNVIQGVATILTSIGAIQILGKVANFFTGASEKAADYETALNSLSAITGATGRDLEELSDRALVQSKRFGESGVDIVEAYKLVGSARAELLKDTEALDFVTERAIRLAKATGDTVPASVKALVGTLNQFQLPASAAERVMNALAAGAEAGAAEVPDLSAAMDKFGVSAGSSNIKVEESIALIETLAIFELKGAEAGTALRNVLGKLSTAKALSPDALEQLEKFGVNLDIVTDKTRPVEERLTEMSKISGDATALFKVFGEENRIAGEIILSNVDKFKELNEAVTGTDAAIRQAEINQEGLTEAKKRFGAQVDAVKIVVGQLINTALVPLLQTGTKLILILTEIPNFIRENKAEIITLGVALVALNAQQIAASISALRNAAAQKAATIATRAMTIANLALNAVLTANPIGLIVAAIAALVIGLIQAYKRSDEVRAVISGLGRIAKEVFTIIKEAIQGFADAFNALKEGRIGDALKSIGQSIIKTNPIGIALTQGARLKDAFMEGYSEKKASDAAEREAEELAAKADSFTKAGTDLGKAAGQGVVDGIAIKFKDIAKLTKSQIEAELEKVGKTLSDLSGAGQEGSADYEAYAARQIALQDALNAKLGIAQDRSNDKKKAAEEKLAAEQRKIKEDKLKLDLEAIRLGTEREAILLESSFLKKDISEAEYNEKVFQQRIKGLDAQIAQTEASGVAEAAAIEKIQNEKLRLQNEYDKKVNENAEKKRASDEQFAKDRLDNLLKTNAESLAAEELALKEKILLQEENDKLALNDRFANQVKAEQAFQEQLLQLKIENFDAQLALLKANGYEETEAYERIKQQKLDTQIDFNKKQLENEKRTQEMQREIEKASITAANDFFDLSIEMLSKDKEARKKNAGAIIAFQSAKIFTNLYSEISGYYSSMSALGPVGVAIASVMSGVATFRAINNISKLKAQEFYDGGQVMKKDPFILPMLSGKDGRFRYQPNITPTKRGDDVLAYVKTGETILTPQHVNRLGGPETMRRIGVPGYNTGGITGLIPSEVNTTPVISSISFQSSASGEMNMLLSEVKGLRSDVQNANKVLKAIVVYSELEQIQNDILNTQNRASI
jgi:TP901 family phage tail tape measure protein